MQPLADSSETALSGTYATGDQYRDHVDSGPNLFAALWRYRWAVALPALLGLVAGFVVYLQMPDKYRSTTRLIVESDRSPIMDAVTGEMIGGVPTIEVVQSHLFSDQVIRSAFQDPRMLPFHDFFPGGLENFMYEVVKNEALVLEPEFADSKSAREVVTLLHFDSPNEELSEAAVKSFSEALQDFYNRKHKSSRSELLAYMVDATERLYPEFREMKERYRNFRKEAPLQWDANGGAINPHRDHQMFLVERRAQIQEELRRAQTEQAAVRAVSESTEDPLVTLGVIGQLLERRFTLPDLNLRPPGFGADDVELENLKVERDLVPLMVELAKMEAVHGANHPSVQDLSQTVEGLRAELRKLVEQQTERISELIDTDQKRAESAASALEAITRGLETQVAMLSATVQSLNNEIAQAAAKAAELAEFELRNEDLLSEMEQQKMLMIQIEDQMARVELTEEESGTRIFELMAPTEAYLVSPILYKTLGIGTFIGLMVGGGLAFLLEKNSNTFRDPEEIAEVVGAPVLTHLPFFKGRVRKGRKQEINAFESLDSRLAVVHAPASVTAEAMRSCRTSVFFETSNIPGGKVIQCTSPLPGDGKSTIAGNLACAIAQSGKKTIVVDCDLRRPQLSDNFSVSDKQGLTDVLDGRCEVVEAVHDTPIETLKVMPSGPIPANPAEALTLPDMNQLFEVLRQKFDYILVDSPPLLLVTDPSILASYADGVLLAVKVRRKSKPNTREAARILSGVGAKILGVVVNNSDESGKSDGYRGHGYYRYGRQASRYRRSYGRGGNASYYSSRTQDGSQPLVVSGRQVTSDMVGAAGSSPPSNGQASEHDS